MAISKKMKKKHDKAKERAITEARQERALRMKDKRKGIKHMARAVGSKKARPLLVAKRACTGPSGELTGTIAQPFTAPWLLVFVIFYGCDTESSTLLPLLTSLGNHSAVQMDPTELGWLSATSSLSKCLFLCILLPIVIRHAGAARESVHVARGAAGAEHDDVLGGGGRDHRRQRKPGSRHVGAADDGHAEGVQASQWQR